VSKLLDLASAATPPTQFRDTCDVVWVAGQSRCCSRSAEPGEVGPEVYRPQLGTPTEEAELVHEENEEGFSLLAFAGDTFGPASW